MEITKKIDIVFMGTAEFGAPLLRALASDPRFRVTLVVTQEDRPAGRNLKMMPSPIKQVAEELGIPVFQPKDVNAGAFVGARHTWPLQMIVVVAYGQILKKQLLNLPPFGCINVHASLLPKYRGASPIQSALLGGETESGISVMQMEEGLDSGPVFKMISTPLASDETAITLHDRLTEIAGKEVPEILSELFLQKIKAKAQDEAGATHCSKITKEAGKIDWSESAEAIERKVRAFAGWPGTFTTWNGKQLKILEATAIDASEIPGKIFYDKKSLCIGAGKGSLEIKTLQLEGKKAQSADEFVRGHPDFIGSTLGK